MEAIACIGDATPPWAEILTATRDLIGADSGSLIMLDGAGDLLHVNHVGLAESTLKEYEQHFHKLDLLAHAAARHEAGGWIDSNEAIPRATLLRSEFHNDYLRKNGQSQIVGLLLERSGSRLTGMSFQRATIESGVRDRLSRGDIGTCIRAFQEALATRQGLVAGDIHVLEETFGAFGEAICLVSRGGAVARMSPLCATLFDDRRGLTLRHGRLHHPNRAVFSQVLDKLSLAIRNRARTQAAVGLASGDTLSLDIAPAPAALQMFGEPLALVRFRRNTIARTIDMSCLIAEFGITPAEARVLAGLVDGRTPLEYAVENSVSENTVRKQIATLKIKMNCSRVVDLVRLAILFRA
jgi:DNA-binding CsgD family transcriptional regulator